MEFDIETYPKIKSSFYQKENKPFSKKILSKDSIYRLIIFDRRNKKEQINLN